MPDQFPYPEQGWSAGRMKMAARGQFRGNPAEQFRELEGERKKRETKVSFDFSKLSDVELQQHHESLMTELERRKGSANGP